VRCRVVLAQQSPGLCTGGAALGTYSDEVQLLTTWRITDDYNDTVPPSCGTSAACKTATVIDIPYPTVTTCSDGNRNVTTTANAIVPGSIQAGVRANIRTGQAQLFDGGADGLAATADNEVFATKGIFVP
jgi:hypothetical protein